MESASTHRFGKANISVPSRLPRGFVFMLLPILLATLLVVSGCGRVKEADSEYEQVLDQIDEIHAKVEHTEFYELTPEDLAWLEQEFITLSARIENISGLTSLPLGLDRALGSAEIGSSRYRATMDMLEVARLLGLSGRTVASIGQESMTALEDTGIRADSDSDGATWLDVLHRRESELNDALDILDEALLLRESINDDDLPHRVRSQLEKVDALTDRFSTQIELAHDLPLAFVALGAEEPVRYLALFQNPAELRPTGGFIGTVAVVEIDRGQVSSYEFHDVYDLSVAYQQHVIDPIDPPWAIARFVRPDFLQYQDANWPADFPVSAQRLLDMTLEAGWEDIDAVVAVQPDAIADMLSITGPISVDVDGEERRITHENLQAEAERQRRIAREGATPETGHKEVINLIGEVLLDHFSGMERDDMIDAALLVIDSLDRRDVQAYHPDDGVQAFLEERNWAGRISPAPDIPTLGTVFANVTGLKTSLAMQPALHLELAEDDENGMFEVVLRQRLHHTGAEGADAFYEGFQRWWLDVVLPEEASVTQNVPNPAEDPDASNGGAYVIDLEVGEEQEVTVSFTMPGTEQILIRRQPGLVTQQVVISRAGCSETLEFDLDRDAVIVLDSTCPFVQMDAESD